MSTTLVRPNLGADPYALSRLMDFDHIIEVHVGGYVSDGPAYVWAPDCIDTELRPGSPWTLLDGFSGQYGYSGPGMHASEFIGGGLARHILATPGYWVALVDEPSDIDEEPEGWCVAFMPAHPHTYRFDKADWWCTTCDTVTDFCEGMR